MKQRYKVWNFNAWAERYDKIVSEGHEIYEKYDLILNFIVQITKPKLGKLVLDIGTGTGNLALRFLPFGARIIGLDPSRRMLEMAYKKAYNNPMIEFYYAPEPFLHIPYPDNFFDIVVSSYAFHHVPKKLKRKGIREMYRVLKRNGVWALGDLMFKDKRGEESALQKYDWLEEEYFTHIFELQKIFKKLGIKLKTKQFTPVSWVVWAIK